MNDASFYCGSCGMESLDCMNRERMDRHRCCQHCDGHRIPITAKGRKWLASIGHPNGDGITLLQFMIQAERQTR